jgi:hypothetical protein
MERPVSRAASGCRRCRSGTGRPPRRGACRPPTASWGGDQRQQDDLGRHLAHRLRRPDRLLHAWASPEIRTAPRDEWAAPTRCRRSGLRAFGDMPVARPAVWLSSAPRPLAGALIAERSESTPQPRTTAHYYCASRLGRGAYYAAWGWLHRATRRRRRLHDSGRARAAGDARKPRGEDMLVGNRGDNCESKSGN